MLHACCCIIQGEVTKLSGPELKKLFTDRCAHVVYEKKEVIRAVWGPSETVPLSLAAIQVHTVAPELTWPKGLEAEPEDKEVTFDDVWQHVEQGLVAMVCNDN